MPKNKAIVSGMSDSPHVRDMSHCKQHPGKCKPRPSEEVCGNLAYVWTDGSGQVSSGTSTTTTERQEGKGIHYFTQFTISLTLLQY